MRIKGRIGEVGPPRGPLLPAFRVLFAFGSTKEISRPGRNAPTVRPWSNYCPRKKLALERRSPGKPGASSSVGLRGREATAPPALILGQSPSPFLFLASQILQVSRRETCKCALTPFGIQRQQKKKKKRKDSPRSLMLAAPAGGAGALPQYCELVGWWPHQPETNLL